MAHYIASEVLNERLLEIIAVMKSNHGSHADYILQLEELLLNIEEKNFGTWQPMSKVVRYSDAPD
jgi:hypothetical protein